MATFDLRTEPWIPVRYVDGHTGEVGLRDALVNAHHICELDLDNPMETAALYRLLLALAIRINPETEQDAPWFDRWDMGRFDEVPIDGYFEKWKERFDLFHPKHPFYQVREDGGQTPIQPSYLRLHEGGNTSSLFSGDNRKRNDTLAPSEAARGVVASQYAAIGGLLSNPYKTGNKNSPGVGGTLFWIHGESLFHSLMLNAPPSIDARMGGTKEEDRPAWEVDPSRTKTTRPRKGFLDYLTYQYRRLTLETMEIDGVTAVTSFRRTGGDNEEEIPLEDPHVAILAGDPVKKTAPRRFNISVGRAVWRDSSVFLTMASSRGTPPRTVQWGKSNLADLGISVLEIELLGMRTRGANDGTIKIWRSERLPLYLSLLSNIERAATLTHALEIAENQEAILRKSAFVAAINLLSDGSDKVAELTNALNPVPRFWPAIEPHFMELIQRIAKTPGAGADPDWATPVLRSWYRILHLTALRSFDTATASLEKNARQLRAVAIARASIKPAERYHFEEISTITDEEVPL